MKKLLLLSIAILPLLCTAQDDLYFVSKKTKKETVERYDLRARTEKVAPADVVDYHSSRRDDDRNLGGLPDWGVIYQMIHTGNALKPVPQADAETTNKKGFFSKLFGA